MVFIVRGSLYLVAVSSRGEPAAVLRRQLAVLYSQILCILTNGFERMFARNPRFDSRRLLGTALHSADPASHRLPILPELQNLKKGARSRKRHLASVECNALRHELALAAIAELMQGFASANGAAHPRRSRECSPLQQELGAPVIACTRRVAPRALQVALTRC